MPISSARGQPAATRPKRRARRRLFNIYDLPIDGDARVEDTALADAWKSSAGTRESISGFRSVRGPSDTPVGLWSTFSMPREYAPGGCGSGTDERLVARRQHRNAGFPRRGRPACGAIAGNVRTLPGNRSGQQAQRPHDGGSRRRVGEGSLDVLSAIASGSAKPADLLRMALRGSAADMARLLMAGLPGGLIKLLPALALGFVANHIVAGGSAGTLYAVAVTLAGFGLLGALLHLLQSTSMMRLEGSSASRVEAAFWDRLMRLPPSVLRRRPAGDLAMSGMTFQNLRDGIREVVADGLLSIIFLLPVFGIIFFYDATLGVVALIFSLASLLVNLAIGLRQIPPHGRMISATRRVAGRLFQIVGGIAKLRVGSAEGSAFAIWARDYREQKRAEIEVGGLEGHSRAFRRRAPLSCRWGACFSRWQPGTTGASPVGDFLVVYTVFIAFQSAIARLGESFGVVAAMLPAFDQMRPLLAPGSRNRGRGRAGRIPGRRNSLRSRFLPLRSRLVP